MTTRRTVERATLSGDRVCYGVLFTDTHKYAKQRYEEMLSEVGIKKTIFDKKPVSKIDLIFSSTTLVILPNIIDSIKPRIETKTFKIDGLDFVVHPAYDVLDSECTRIREGEIVVLDYYNRRNLLILYFNPFPIIPRITKFKIALDFIVEKTGRLLPYNNQEILAKQYAVKNATIFMRRIREQCNKLIGEVETSFNRIDKFGRDIICEYEKIRLNNISIESLKKFMSDFPTDFERRIKEIKELPFIRSVEITEEGIKIDYGEIYIDYNKNTYYIGDMYAILTPEEVKIYNKDNNRNKYPHQHATPDHRPCFGNTSGEISKLLFEMNFKKLAFLISQYLKTYSPSGTPFTNISNWEKEPKKSKKTEKEINNPIQLT